MFVVAKTATNDRHIIEVHQMLLENHSIMPRHIADDRRMDVRTCVAAHTEAQIATCWNCNDYQREAGTARLCRAASLTVAGCGVPLCQFISNCARRSNWMNFSNSCTMGKGKDFWLQFSSNEQAILGYHNL